VKMGIMVIPREIEWWMGLARDREQWRAVVLAVLKLRALLLEVVKPSVEITVWRYSSTLQYMCIISGDSHATYICVIFAEGQARYNVCTLYLEIVKHATIHVRYVWR
jgi:hypothetical protein